MDIFFEFLVEVYLSICEILVPEKKFKKWQETLLKVLCLVCCLVILGCLCVGITLLVEEPQHYAVGVALVCAGSVLLAVQVALVTVAIVHDVKKERAKKKKLLESDVQELIENSEDF